MGRKYVTALLAFGSLTAVPVGPAAAEVLLYDLDFGSPPHTVGLPPEIGVGPPPRLTPTNILQTPPIVVSAVGALDDQPVRFEVDFDHLSQIGFAVNNPFGFDEKFPQYRLEIDLLVETLDAASSEMTIFVDTPLANRIDFNFDGTVEVRVPGPDGYSETIGSYDLGTPVAVEVLIDIEQEQWAITLDGTEAFVGGLPSERLSTFRVSLEDFEPYGAVSAADNIRLYGIPTPATLALFAVAVALGRRRRRRSRASSLDCGR